MTAGHGKSLINYLLNRCDFVSGQELSATLDVSTKTVSRIVKQINDQYENGPIIESQRGRGYRLNYQNYYDHRDQVDSTVDVGGLSSVERRDEIIKRLLITSPQQYRMNDIWGKFYISDSAIASDMKILRHMLGKFHLTLSRSSDYIWVEGVEADIRRAIPSLLFADDVIVSGQFDQPNQLIKQRDAAFVTHQLDLIEDMTRSEIPYPYSVNLFTHLYILIERFRSAGSIIDKYGGTSADEPMRNGELVAVCNKVIANLGAYLDTPLPRIEVYNLYRYLTSSRIDDNRVDPGEIPDLVRDVTEYLISRVIEDPQYRDINSQDLFIGLAKHMRPLLNRLENGIRVTNNLLEQIKLEYMHLFETVKVATEDMARRYGLNRIDDEEAGFITVYFAQAVENRRMPLDILLVCTTGLGTAQLLRAKIEKRFAGFHIVQTVAARDIDQAIDRHPEIDLVVSTIRLGADVHLPTLVVSAMLTVEDQDRLEREADLIRKGVTRRCDA